MTTQTQNTPMRGLLTKRPFYRISPECGDRYAKPLSDIGEQSVTGGKLFYEEVTQADFLRELDTNAHAINDRNLYRTYRQNDEDNLYYEEDFPRYAFPFQQEIADDHHSKLTNNDIQFDLADKKDTDQAWDDYNDFKAGWAEKRMENAWHFIVKAVLTTGDGAFAAYLDNGKFYWKVMSFANGDVLYPHYDIRTGRLNVFARTYTSYDDNGNSRNYVDVWDDRYYYRLVEGTTAQRQGEQDNAQKDEKTTVSSIGGFSIDGYEVDDWAPHGFDEIPVAYKRSDTGPCWSCVQETIEHYEAAFSRLAQSNHTFGLPIMFLQGDGKKIQEIATSDMSYASKIFIIPSDGKAGFLERQDASGAYKAELEELRKKIYEGAMVIKQPELKSGDTPAAAIKLLYSDAYNKAMLEAQEYDECLNKMIHIFRFGYGIEAEKRLAFLNLKLSYYVQPFIPINESELCQNLSLGVQNGYLSKQTAAERNPYATPNEWTRILQEKHDEQMQELLLEDQKLDIQQTNTVETQEQLSDIQTQQQIEVINAQNNVETDSNRQQAPKVTAKKRSVATGRRPGRPVTVGTDKWGNRQNENNWGNYNTTH